jgi:iron-sulfur cluster repair protein YtfE (RIC family)
MRLSEIRDELLREHAQLRRQISDVHAASECWKNGTASLSQVRAHLTALVDALLAHNQHEEKMLGGIVLKVDAWGPVRSAIMGEEHLKEHGELLAALTSTSSAAEPWAWCELVYRRLADLVNHMDREEQVFLNDEVLRDDSVAIGYEGA